MLHYDKVFRVRITTEMQSDIARAETKWRHLHRWQRPGELYRLIIKLGLISVLSGISTKR